LEVDGKPEGEEITPEVPEVERLAAAKAAALEGKEDELS
jgi:hypothetical protein